MQITFNGKKIAAVEGRTILETARANGIDIPSLCYHPDLEVKASCRLCLVSIRGKRGLQTACSTPVEPEMEIVSESAEINQTRKTNLELLFAQYKKSLGAWDANPELLRLAKKYQIDVQRFSDRKKHYPKYQFGPAVLFDTSKCIDCRNCVDACRQQSVNFLEVKEKKTFFQPTPSQDKKTDCIYCGQCVVHCPVAALSAVPEFNEVEKALKQKGKTVVFQFAPSIRTSIGEEFNLPSGAVVTEKIVGALKALGAEKVFDTSVGADFTSTEEAKELVEKIQTGKGVCLSSCCPSWVKYVEFFYPEFVHCLATTRSPQVILGGLIKTYFAGKDKIDPKKIVVVSIMPCTAKKYEIRRKELEINGMKPVDYVLTTRELTHLFKKHDIDLKSVKPEKADDPLGLPTGGGVIYGASGGVAESALRSAHLIMSKTNLPKIEFTELRGLQGIKKALIKMGDRTVKMAVINGIGNAKIILDELKKDPKAYDAVEVMACPGGCIGGGGQPVPTDGEIRSKRASSLYEIDAKKQERIAHLNPVVKEVYKDYLTSEKIIKTVCHTNYAPKKKEVNF
ncbi:MAG: [FeFe] hydrogenase, group A [Candidatus Nealsonbacteria bacterium]